MVGLKFMKETGKYNPQESSLREGDRWYIPWTAWVAGRKVLHQGKVPRYAIVWQHLTSLSEGHVDQLLVAFE